MQNELLLDLLAKEHIADLHREARLHRLAAEAIKAQGGRPLRSRLADGLHALAARIEGAPRLSPSALEA
jgi:hypothetical protein